MQSRKNGQKHIWLLAGTGEGRTLATVLVEQGWNVTVSVVSSKASWPYLEMSLTCLLVGALKGVEGIKQVLKQANYQHEGFDWVIDVTHPFAVEISSNLQTACAEVGQPLLRFERPLGKTPRQFLLEDSRELSNYSLEGRNLLIALGSRHLRAAVEAAHCSGAKVFARVLPTPDSFKKALMFLLPESGLAVMHPFQGSFSGDLERALCRRWSISDVICRQSGGLTQKLWQEICQDENIHLWLIARPNLSRGVEVFYTFNSLLQRLSVFEKCS